MLKRQNYTSTLKTRTPRSFSARPAKSPGTKKPRFDCGRHTEFQRTSTQVEGKVAKQLNIF